MTRNSNLMSEIDSASKKNYEKTYYMPQSEIWYESYVFRSLGTTSTQVKVQFFLELIVVQWISYHTKKKKRKFEVI